MTFPEPNSPHGKKGKAGSEGREAGAGTIHACRGFVAEARGSYGAILGLASLFPSLLVPSHPISTSRSRSNIQQQGPTNPLSLPFRSFILFRHYSFFFFSLYLSPGNCCREAGWLLHLSLAIQHSHPSSQKTKLVRASGTAFSPGDCQEALLPPLALLCMDASSTKLPPALLSASPAAALFSLFFSPLPPAFCCRRVSFRVPSHLC